MGWSIGYDDKWKRDIGYGVPAICDHPDCNKEIDRGLGYVCGGNVYGGEHGCGLFFCGEHRLFKDISRGMAVEICEKCLKGLPSFEPKPDAKEWVNWKLTDESWQQWRDENPEEVERLKKSQNALY